MLYSYNGALYYSEWEITIKVNNEKSPIIVEWNTQVAGQVTVTRCLLIQFLKYSYWYTLFLGSGNITINKTIWVLSSYLMGTEGEVIKTKKRKEKIDDFIPFQAG